MFILPDNVQYTHRKTHIHVETALESEDVLAATREEFYLPLAEFIYRTFHKQTKSCSLVSHTVMSPECGHYPLTFYTFKVPICPKVLK